MSTTATKGGQNSTSAGHPTYGWLCTAGDDRKRRFAGPSQGRKPKPDREPSLPEVRTGRVISATIKDCLRFKENIVVMRTVPRGSTYDLVEVRDTATDGPEPPPSALVANPISAQAFIKHMEHMNFLRRISMGDSPPITLETASLAAKAWLLIWKASDLRMTVPAAGTGPDGEMFYAWNCGRYHLELEIIPGKSAEFFYRDRETGEFWGEDYDIGAPLPIGVVSKLDQFQ